MCRVNLVLLNVVFDLLDSVVTIDCTSQILRKDAHVYGELLFNQCHVNYVVFYEKDFKISERFSRVKSRCFRFVIRENT
jgi:hypothetical protein